MQIRPDQLTHRLKNGLAPVYLVSGDEPLLVSESADAIRVAAQRAGYDEQVVLHADSTFDWSNLGEQAQAMSLFAARRLIDLRITANPRAEGAKALVRYAKTPAEDTVLLVVCGKLEKKDRASKWYKALEQCGVAVTIRPLKRGELTGWINRRMRALGLQPTPEAAALLADRTEGNLLAASQEIYKLTLTTGKGQLDAQAVARSVTDASRFTVFDLVDATVSGAVARSLHILNQLRAEGIEAILVLWALNREIRQLAQMTQAMDQGQSADQALRAVHIWSSRQPLVKQALNRNRPWRSLLKRCALIDQQIKGQALGRPWDELLQLTVEMAG